jgi:hypothetical protein
VVLRREKGSATARVVFKHTITLKDIRQNKHRKIETANMQANR